MLEPLIERLRAEQLVEVRGSAGTGSATYRYALTDGGRDRARQYLDFSHYVGPAPVTAGGLRRRRCARWPRRAATSIASACAQGFSHLIISDQVLEQLGPAVNAGKAVFLYGPPGNGKTVIAEGTGPRARRRHVHAACDRRRRPHADDVRSDQSRIARGRRRVVERHLDRRRAIAAGCASGGRWSWSAAS